MVAEKIFKVKVTGARRHKEAIGDGKSVHDDAVIFLHGRLEDGPSNLLNRTVYIRLSLTEFIQMLPPEVLEALKQELRLANVPQEESPVQADPAPVEGDTYFTISRDEYITSLVAAYNLGSQCCKAVNMSRDGWTKDKEAKERKALNRLMKKVEQKRMTDTEYESFTK